MHGHERTACIDDAAACRQDSWQRLPVARSYSLIRAGPSSLAPRRESGGGPPSKKAETRLPPAIEPVRSV